MSSQRPEADERPPPLPPYRVLDLTEGGINWAGRVLADLGADVVKVEPPEGSPTRRRGPFYGDVPHPERSLFWFAYCANKRGITLDLESPAGRQRFRELAARADLVLESFAPGYLEGLGLGYADLRSANPGVVVTSVTPFGQTGPYAGYKAPDLVAWSMGGMAFVSGDEDRPPVRVGFPQAELHAGAHAAAASLIALWHRRQTGRGQHIDVSVQSAVVWTIMNAAAYPELQGENVQRSGASTTSETIKRQMHWKCKDGHVASGMAGGIAMGRSTARLVQWMDEEGFATQVMRERDWVTWDVYRLMLEGGPEADEFNAAQDQAEQFFATKDKAELYERAVAERIILAPCNTVRDIAESPQLEARDYWAKIHHPELDATISYPGPFVKLSESPVRIQRPAPLIGQHNDGLWEQAAPHTSEPASSKAASNDSMPFEGLKVLDLTWVAVGPITMKFLGDHGATVVRVESVTRPDPARSVPPFGGATPGFNRSAFSSKFNTNKLGLGLNLAKPKAREIIERLLREWRPDVIAESFTPKAMRSWGLDYKSVSVYRPDIIYFSTCQQGQTGPHAAFAGYGPQASALSGFAHITGWADRDPAGPYGAYTDFVNPPNAAAAVIAALEFRRRTGKGQHIDLSQYECAVHYLAPAVLDYHVNGRVLGRNGNRDDFYAPHGIFRCRDSERFPEGGSWCAIAVTGDEEWRALAGIMGRADWLEDSRFATLEGRKAHEAELEQAIGDWTSTRDSFEVMRSLQEAGVPAGVVQKGSDVWSDPQLAHRGHFRMLNHTECGPMPYETLPFHLSETPAEMSSAAPLVGEHNLSILEEFLGMSGSEVGVLLEEGVLETS